MEARNSNRLDEIPTRFLSFQTLKLAASLPIARQPVPSSPAAKGLGWRARRTNEMRPRQQGGCDELPGEQARQRTARLASHWKERPARAVGRPARRPNGATDRHELGLSLSGGQCSGRLRRQVGAADRIESESRRLNGLWPSSLVCARPECLPCQSTSSSSSSSSTFSSSSTSLSTSSTTSSGQPLARPTTAAERRHFLHFRPAGKHERLPPLVARPRSLPSAVEWPLDKHCTVPIAGCPLHTADRQSHTLARGEPDTRTRQREKCSPGHCPLSADHQVGSLFVFHALVGLHLSLAICRRAGCICRCGRLKGGRSTIAAMVHLFGSRRDMARVWSARDLCGLLCSSPTDLIPHNGNHRLGRLTAAD